MMVFAWSYAIAVNFVPSYRDPADKIGASRVGIDNANPKIDEEVGVTGDSGKALEVEVANASGPGKDATTG